MQFSEQWLRHFVDPRMDSEALGQLLTMAGLEVEEMNAVGGVFTSVVVGHILSTEKHPDADRLKVCQVDAGLDAPLQIVCGAPNAEAGMKVPCAVVGAQLPGFEIKKAKLRGVASHGMLCSARELGLSDEHAGLHVLPADAPVGQDVRTLLGLDDTVFVIKLTPNRADCLSLVGVAREVAALLDLPLNLPDLTPVVPAIDDIRPIVLDAPAACPRFCGRVIRGVDARAKTPEWMVRRLERSGIRAISALVDITNYVMLELGQPLHAYDNDRLDGTVRARLAQPGEQLLLLNEQTIDLDAGTLVIADDARVLGMAGIMGGEESGISLDTRDMFLEAAFFAPEAIAGRAREYGFGSDASHRFERGVDFDLSPKALERATALILEICGGQAGPAVQAESAEHLPARPAVTLRPARARRVLGIDLSDEAMANLLARVHLDVERDGDTFRVTPPSYRFDIEIEEDLVEELARLHGYDNIPAPAPTGHLAMLDRPEDRRDLWQVKRMVADREYQEVVTYAFIEEAWERDFCGNTQPIRLANPIASQMNVMRSSLIPGLIGTLLTNRKRQNPRVRIFETGRCFRIDPAGQPVAGYDQPVRLGLLAASGVAPEQWGVAQRNVDFYDLKGDLEALFAPRVLSFEAAEHPALHPGRSARILCEGRAIGFLGEIHPKWVQNYELGTAPVVCEVDTQALLAADLPVYSAISRQPAVVRDMALVVANSVAAMPLMAALKQAAPAIVRDVQLFDVYQGKGVDPDKKSLAFRVLMQDTQRTLEDAEVDAAVAALVQCAQAQFNAALRG
ncbi:phenylalanine--tRNA ligase subunit beta [Denitromonas iodatirespirans]|uniref:Phenylalanine--tRNA ligase beta subunit n=1 Tax=Denitromonas iodatirespirans TaxID=2795389 RepID=A0A944H860_DENI1|nr:phenylalanine--tRNA ligase subunit beta [Denitromonas iodatirespirans]MBT0961958.1 phenylalanine--tRNA ligase subunit beta [Denitromonas iodatirespirans]